MCRKHYRRWLRHGDAKVVHRRVTGAKGHPAAKIGDRRRSPHGYVRVKSPGHPLCPRSSHWVYEHRVVLYDQIGPGAHDCHWCGRSVAWGKSLTVDHLDGDKGHNAAANLVPACTRCNVARGKGAALTAAATDTHPDHRRPEPA